MPYALSAFSNFTLLYITPDGSIVFCVYMLYFFNAVDPIAKSLAAEVHQLEARRYRRSRQQPEASPYSYLCLCPSSV